MQTASLLDIDVPPTLLALATEVIEQKFSLLHCIHPPTMNGVNGDRDHACHSYSSNYYGHVCVARRSRRREAA